MEIAGYILLGLGISALVAVVAGKFAARQDKDFKTHCGDFRELQGRRLGGASTFWCRSVLWSTSRILRP